MNKLLQNKAVIKHEHDNLTSTDYKEFFKSSKSSVKNSIGIEIEEFGTYFNKDLEELNSFIEKWNFGPIKVAKVTDAYWALVPIASLRQRMATEGPLSGSAHYWPGRRAMWKILKGRVKS